MLKNSLRTVMQSNLVLAVPIFFLLVFLICLDWIFPIVPSGDGPFQTINWILRIREGQVPGRDFDVFHGLGILWSHALLAIPFQSMRGIIFVHYFGALFFQGVLLSCVARFQLISWEKSILAGCMILACVRLTEAISFANFASLISAGHSLIGSRVALALLCIVISIRYSGKYSVGMLRKNLIFSLGAGCAAWFATDQALASIMAAAAISVSSAFLLSKGWRKGCLLVLPIFVTSVASSILVYASLIYISTLGNVKLPMEYWWQVLPKVQFWYFGGAPNAFVREWTDVMEWRMILLLVCCLIMHIYGIVMRKPGNLPYHLGFSVYGVCSLAPMVGIFASYYFAGLFCSGLISLMMARFPETSWVRHKIPLIMKVGVCTVTLTLSVKIASNRMKHNDRFAQPEVLNKISADNQMKHQSRALPAFVMEEFELLDAKERDNILRAFYRAAPEIALNQKGVGRYDYIIHALSEEHKQQYERDLMRHPPLFLRVPCQKNFLYAQWLWHQWPQLWTSILSQYRFESLHNGSAYWRRISPKPLSVLGVVPISLGVASGGYRIKVEEGYRESTILRFKVTYRSIRRGGVIGGATDRLTRVTVSQSGVHDGQSFSWPSGMEFQTREVMVVPQASASVEVSIVTEGPLLSSDLEVSAVTVERLSCAHIDGLAEMLKN